MFDAATAIRALGYPVRSHRTDTKAPGVEATEAKVKIDARAKRPTNQGWRTPEWWENHNYQFQSYKGIFGGR